MMGLLKSQSKAWLVASSPSDQTKDLLEEVWQSIVNQKWYTQIHLLDITGKELVRVNYSAETGHITLPQELQDKSGSNTFNTLKN